MGYNNSRTIVLDAGFRSYESTTEMLSDFLVIAGTPTLGKHSVTSLHPARCMEFVGITGDVGVEYSLTSPLAEPLDADHLQDLDAFETTVWVQMDAGLAGSQLRVSGDGGFSATTTYAMPSDGSWVEIGHTYTENAIDGSSLGIKVELIGVTGTGTFRIGRIFVRRVKNHWTTDSLADGIVIPFMSDTDTLTIEWRTNIVECWDGSEVRTIHRLVPVGTLKSEFLIQDEEDSALLESILYGSAGKLFFIPFWPDSIEMEDMGFDIWLDVEKMIPRLFHVGGAVMFWNSPFDYATRVIQTTNGDNDALTGHWFAGYPAGTIAVPLLSGYLSPVADLILPTPEDRKLTATFTVNLLGGSET